MDTETSIPHYKFYLHLFIPNPHPQFYLLDFRPGTVGFEVANSESLSSTTSTPWGQVYALPLEICDIVKWNMAITDGLSGIDIMVLMQTLEVINEETSKGGYWMIGKEAGEGGAFKIMLQFRKLESSALSLAVRPPVRGSPALSFQDPLRCQDTSASKLGNRLVRYLLVVPGGGYTLWGKEREGIEPVTTTVQPISRMR